MSVALRQEAGTGPSYEEAKRLARSEREQDRLRLAESQDVRPEILFFLTADPAVEVRCAIASNPATPRQADVMVIETEKSGKKFELHADPKEVSSRGGKGHQVMKRVTFKVIEKPVTIQPLANAEGGQGVN